MHDVVVVGGGPAGSSTAAALAKDHDVLVLEEHAEIGRPIQCAGLVTERSIGLSGVRPEILNRFEGADVIFPNGKVITVRPSNSKAVLIDRSDFDRRLYERAMDNGAEYELSTRFVSHSVKDGTVSIETSNGNLESILIIGADGHSSKVASSIPDNGPKEYVRGMEYDLKHTMDDQDTIRIRIGTDIAPGLFSWEIPFGEYTRVGLCATWSEGLPIDFMKVLLKRAGLEDREVVKKYCGKVPLGRRRRMYSDNMLLIGDAASHVKPVSAGGIYPLLMSVGPLCETVKEAFAEDDLSARSLSRYEKRWYPLVGKDLDKVYRLRKHYIRFNNEDMNGIYPYLASDSVMEALNSVDIDNPSISSSVAVRNIPLALKIMTTMVKSKVRR